LLLHLLIRLEVIVHTTVEAKVKAGRQRIGGGTEKEVRKKVEAEVLGGAVGMSMVELLREVSGHPGVEDAVRRDVEVKEFNFWKKLVGVLRFVTRTRRVIADDIAKKLHRRSSKVPRRLTTILDSHRSPCLTQLHIPSLQNQKR
jgi:hypothetical protein